MFHIGFQEDIEIDDMSLLNEEAQWCVEIEDISEVFSNIIKDIYKINNGKLEASFDASFNMAFYETQMDILATRLISGTIYVFVDGKFFVITPNKYCLIEIMIEDDVKNFGLPAQD